ncbi:translation initiation factor IF-2-like, partial [Camelus ferus]|uniref:Translation initiation factor IF-2-like n=2 Tax=Camelus TaxID=9836 RepID=A0A8B8RY19_CAMFR
MDPRKGMGPPSRTDPRTHPRIPALTRLRAQGTPNATPECGCHRHRRTGHRNPQVQLPALEGLGRAWPRPGDPSRLGPGVGCSRAGVGPGGGAQAARGQAGWLPLRGAERGRPPARLQVQGARLRPLRALRPSPQRPFSASWRAALARAGAPRGGRRDPRPARPRRVPPSRPRLPHVLCARGSCAPGRALPSPAGPGRGRGPGLGGTLSPGAPPLPAKSAAPTRGPPLGVPRCAPRASSAPSPGGGCGSAGGGPAAAEGRRGSRIEPLPRAAPAPVPPRPCNFLPEPTHPPKKSPGENESGGGD